MNSPLNRPLLLPPWLRSLWPLLPALLVLCSLLGLQVAQSPDSLKYLQAAENFHRSGELGADFLHWPPLYPVLLSLHHALGIGANTLAALLGDAGALATLLGAWLLGRRVFSSPLTLALVLLALVSVTRFGTVFASAWSEAVFVPLSVWLACFWTRRLEGEGGLLPACLLLSLALLTRHVGVVLAIAMALTALRLPPRARLQALAAIAAACIPYALWLWRTYLLSGAPMGPRAPLAHPDLAHQLALFGQVWAHWLFPHAYFGGILIGAAVLAAMAAALVAVRDSRFLAYTALVLLGHCVLTVYSASRLFLDVDARTLFPVFWLALFLLAHLLERAVAGRRWAQLLLGAYLLAWFSAPNAIINALV
jgi:hypothetical protein